MKKILLLLTITIALFAFTNSSSKTYKCMVQMTNYSGEGAYIIISLLDKDGDYIKTLQVIGDDQEWYSDITEWWKFKEKNNEDIDAITGATISGGERSISTIEIEDDKIDSGYRIRFESAVEDKEYYKNDIEFELTSESVKSKVLGKGFIRYVRIIPQSN
ncbi:MAG: DUF2271 domain-containing protein [Flavobacteriaceae bacterium]|nr:DUF2271 domain-containing protein [Flavobacteriaceae bacterium]